MIIMEMVIKFLSANIFTRDCTWINFMGDFSFGLISVYLHDHEKNFLFVM